MGWQRHKHILINKISTPAHGVHSQTATKKQFKYSSARWSGIVEKKLKMSCVEKLKRNPNKSRRGPGPVSGCRRGGPPRGAGLLLIRGDGSPAPDRAPTHLGAEVRHPARLHSVPLGVFKQNVDPLPQINKYTPIFIYLFIYIYIYMYVCVCVYI